MYASQHQTASHCKVGFWGKKRKKICPKQEHEIFFLHLQHKGAPKNESSYSELNFEEILVKMSQLQFPLKLTK